MTLSREMFVREGTVWHAELRGEGASLKVSVVAGKAGPDEALMLLVQLVVSDVQRFEQNARVFVRDHAPEHIAKELRLGGLDFLYPSAGWRPNGECVPQDQPIFGMEFEITGDRNVLDVNFVGGLPVEVDYH